MEGKLPDDLADPAVVCIEAGGSGQAYLNNFDHHDSLRYFPPACRQSFDARGDKSTGLERLVEYVCQVDERRGPSRLAPFPSLSNIFSGMLLTVRDPMEQFFSGMRLLSEVLDRNIDPWESMPDLPDWRPYLKAKEENARRVAELLRNAAIFKAADGSLIGYAASSEEGETPVGGIGALYARGCDVVVLYAPFFGFMKERKFTIAGNDRRVSHLLPHLLKHEAGWGGRESIIGSPRSGSRLSESFVLEVVIRYLWMSIENSMIV